MPAVAEEAIRITSLNVETYRAFHRQLHDHLGELIALTQKYPIEIEFKDLRFVFDSEAHLRAVLGLIEARLESHQESKSPRSATV